MQHLIRYKGLLLILIIGTFLDQATKWWAETHLSFYTPMIIWSKRLSFQLVHNYGAAYGILQNQRTLLISISIIVLIGCFIFRKSIAPTKGSQYALAFIYVGTIGNLIDRIRLGYVIDYIDINLFPVFNIADVCIDIGLGIYFLDLIWIWHVTKTNKKTTT